MAQEFLLTDHGWSDGYSARLDTVKMYKYAKFDTNIPCASRVLGVFTLTDHGRSVKCSAKPRPSKKAVSHASG